MLQLQHNQQAGKARCLYPLLTILTVATLSSQKADHNQPRQMADSDPTIGLHRANTTLLTVATLEQLGW
jgi:hypothetical protein